MIRQLRPYEATKQSGVEWLARIPAHWDVIRARYLFREVDERSATGSETHLSMSQRLGLVPSEMVERSLISASYAGGKLCQPEDIVLNRLKAHLGVFALAKQSGVISADYTVLRAIRRLSSRYFEQVLRSAACRSELRVRAKGIVEGFWRLYTDDFYDIRLPVPPLDEQEAIVRFLAYVDNRVEKHVGTKTELIRLLREQSHGIAFQAVTRGLDASVPLKPSGMPSIGEIPASWDLVPARAFLKQRKGFVGERSGDYTLLSLTLGGVVPRDLANPQGKFPADFATYQPVKPGDLIFCLFDVDETPRTVGMAEDPGMVTGAYTVFEGMDAQLTRYLLHFFLAMDEDKRLRPLYTGLRKVVPKRSLLGMKIPIPPPGERDAIIRHIESESSTINEAIGRAEGEIALIRELRLRLSSDVVTGKLDVTEAAAAIPEHLPEADRLSTLTTDPDPLADPLAGDSVEEFA